ncbi:hypothetical protein, partial [Mesomycoplasma hyorhinis]|uniref:hypothetical protein n=1 Tax=Mesomycoplasma hyorhinis TaxID=2100 RepID=UPI001C6918E2
QTYMSAFIFYDYFWSFKLQGIYINIYSMNIDSVIWIWWFYYVVYYLHTYLIFIHKEELAQ